MFTLKFFTEILEWNSVALLSISSDKNMVTYNKKMSVIWMYKVFFIQ